LAIRESFAIARAGAADTTALRDRGRAVLVRFSVMSFTALPLLLWFVTADDPVGIVAE